MPTRRKKLFTPAVRATVFLCSLFAGTGVVAPYLPGWLEATRGLSGQQISMMLAAGMLMRIVTGPLIAAWADKQADRRQPILILAVAALVAYVAVSVFRGFEALFIVGFLAATLNNAMIPLIEARLLRATSNGPLSYGVARAAGSVAFIAANIVGGLAFRVWGLDAVIVWVIAACLVTLGVGIFLLDKDHAPEGVENKPYLSRLSDALQLARRPIIAWTLLAAGLIQATHAFYYGFGTLVWLRQGVSTDFIGLLWALGVGVEVLFLLYSQRIVRHVGPEALILIGGVAGLVRWLIMASAPPMWALVFAQMLHALTFAAVHFGTMKILFRETPEELHASAQTLNASLAGGLFIGMATLMSGYLYGGFGAIGYAAMAGISAVGVLAAFQLVRRESAISKLRAAT
jgi:MFS transporter, PPP family, 3-phenylpropionic acid transporter